MIRASAELNGSGCVSTSVLERRGRGRRGRGRHRDGDHHGAGRHLHAGLYILRCEDQQQASATGSP
jgi:hypothetical protein